MVYDYFEVVHECDDENGDPTSWAITITGDDGKNHFVWISRYDKEYKVEDSKGHDITGITYKTLAGAKRKAVSVAKSQDSEQFFTD